MKDDESNPLGALQALVDITMNQKHSKISIKDKNPIMKKYQREISNERRRANNLNHQPTISSLENVE